MLIATGTLLWIPFAHPGPRFASPRIALPVAAKPPVVDGMIHEDEWAGGVRLAGMLQVGKTALTHRHADSWFLSDGTSVYIAVRSELPPSGDLVANLHPANDGSNVPTIKDDCIEVWLDPAPESKMHGIYQGLINANGAIFDRRLEPAAAWRGDWKMASKLVDGWWHFEASIALSELGVTQPLPGQTWNMRLGRNWKRPWKQSCWSPLAAHFEERNTMATIQWLADAPVTQMLGIRTADGTKAQYRLRIRNPHPQALPLKIRLDSQPTDSQHAYLDKTFTLASGAAQEFTLDHPACMPEETIYTRIHVTRADTGLVCFHREFDWTLIRPAHRWRTSDKDIGPATRFRNALSFHASFDKGINADTAQGTPTGTPVARKDAQPQFVEGLSGQALLSGKDCAAIAFENAGNLNISEGTLSMWIRPVDWHGPGKGDNNHTLFTNGIAGKGYYGVQMARQVSPGPYLCYYMIQYPWRKGVAILASGEMPTWGPDAWHWLVLTWQHKQVTFYVDGVARGRATFDPPLSKRDLTTPAFRVGTGRGKEQTAIDEVMLFNRCLTPSELKEAKAFCRSSAPDAWDALDFKFAYYPYPDKLKALVSLSGLKDKDQVRKATLALHKVGEKAPIATIEMPAFVKDTSEVIADLPKLENGDYQLALSLDPTPGGLSGTLLRGFTRQRFEWERNRIGTSDLILPPFTPLQVADKTVSSVLRDHVMNEQGLWRQVIAKGAPLLAGPMRFEATHDGKLAQAKTSQLKFTEKSGTRVATTAEFALGETAVRVESAMEYDGVMNCTVHLDGGTVDQLDLLIPVKDAMAPLAHICGERCRANFAGYVPKGEGVVWESSEILKREVLTPFVPYIWVGAEERGICWFAETDRYWALDGTSPCQQLERNGDVLTLRIRIIQTPTRLDPRRTIRFGLQATPVKPMPVRPAHWRRWSEINLDRAMQFIIAGSTGYAGHVYHDPFPYRRDLSVWHKLAECRKTGKLDREFVEKWVDSYPAELLEGDGRTRWMRTVMAGQHMAARQSERFLLYVQGRGITFATPEFQTFQDEWTYRDYNSRVWPAGPRDGLSYSSGPVPSWQDYNLWWLKQQMEIFTDGLYFDCFYILPNKDRVASDAYQLPDGRIQPGLPILDQRQMTKRTATMYLEAGRHPMIGPHMTNSTIMPMMSFAQFGLDWEWHYGRSDFQDRWSRDHIRAACTGLQAGCAPIVIGIGAKGGSAEEVEWLHRTFNGVILTHELIPVWYTVNSYIKHADRRKHGTGRLMYQKIRQHLLAMGIGTPACQTYNYWHEKYPLTLTGIETSGIVHRSESETLIILTDYGEGGEARVAIDAKQLGLTPDTKATDFETGEAVPFERNTLHFPLKKHDMEVIRLIH